LMWRDGWFRDYDSVARVWSSERDAMHLAPIFCNVADSRHVEQTRPVLAEPPQHSSQWAPLSWPPVVMTLIGATAAAGMHTEAAELAYCFIDASYRSTDSREPDEHGGLPGVTREYRQAITRGKWRETEYVNAGIEGYGWGALSIHLLMHYVLGLHAEDANRITIAPMIPQALRQQGATYTVETIPWGKYLLSIEYTVKDIHTYKIHLRSSMRLTPEDSEGRPGENEQREAEVYECEWEDTWGNRHTMTLPQLITAQ
jgi:hypothetical protein